MTRDAEKELPRNMTEMLSVKEAPDGTIERSKTFRLLCAVVSTKPEWDWWQLDYTQAYTNAELPEDREVFVTFPPGIMGSSKENPQHARLRRSLYGLADAGLQWYNTLNTQLQDYGMERSADDLCLFTLREDSKVMVLVIVWVDDVLLCGDPRCTKELLDHLEMKFPMRREKPGSFLGVRIHREEDTGQVNIDQSRYIRDALTKYGMEECKTRSVPAVDDPALFTKAGQEGVGTREHRERVEAYRGILGTLIHLTLWTRPDLAFIIGAMARHCSNPTELHLTVTRGILRYLRGSVDCSLSYGVTDRTDQLMAFYDANYAGDRTGAKSTSAFVILLNGAAVTYSSKLQTVVAQSTTEAEVIALAECTRAVIALRGKLEAMGLRQPPETVINVDSQTAIHLAHRPSNGPRSKHYAVRLKFLREHVDRRTVRIVYIPTQHNISDLPTKLLSKVKTSIFRDIMSGKEPVVYT